MKKLLFCGIFALVFTASFGRMDVCRYTYISSCGNETCSGYAVEYGTENGNCCAPTAGAGTQTYQIITPYGYIYEGTTTYASSQELAANNPGCA